VNDAHRRQTPPARRLASPPSSSLFPFSGLPRAMALSGLATVMPNFVVRDDIRSGNLLRLLPKWRLPGGGVFAVLPHLGIGRIEYAYWSVP
jgi:DNA-binding transcriptional LysR family regulator